MKERGVTQADLAKELGVTPQYISGITTGRLTVSLKRLGEIADILGVDPSELIIGEPRGQASFRCPHCGALMTVTTGEED